jgi:arginase
MQNLCLIEAPSNLGLIEPSPGAEPGTKFFPQAMEREGFAGLSVFQKKIIIPPHAYSMVVDEESKVRNADKIINYSIQLANALDNPVQKKSITVVLGGDCSILMGAALSLKRNSNYGLFFLGGHTDYVTPEQSGTSGAAGMDLAIITGHGHNKLTDIEKRKPYIKEENVFCVGNRELSPEWYVNAIIQSDIHYYDLSSLRSKGIALIVKDFLKMVADKKPDGFWIHFDVDVLNNDIMPCVDSPQEDGLSYEELKLILNPLVHSDKFGGIDITIFDPTLDKEGVYAKQFAKEMGEILQSLQ